MTCAAIAGVLVCDKPDGDQAMPFWRFLEDHFKESECPETVTFESSSAVLNSIAAKAAELAVKNFPHGAQKALHAA